MSTIRPVRSGPASSGPVVGQIVTSLKVSFRASFLSKLNADTSKSLTQTPEATTKTKMTVTMKPIKKTRKRTIDLHHTATDLPFSSVLLNAFDDAMWAVRCGPAIYGHNGG